MQQVHQNTKIEAKIAEKIKILDLPVQVICDNDLDGICSGILSCIILKRLNKNPILTIRDKGKHSVEDLKELVSKDAGSIIIVDCPFEPDEELIRFDKRKVLYIDHHKRKIPENIPENFFWFDIRSLGLPIVSCTEIVYRVGKVLFEDFSKFILLAFIGSFGDYLPTDFIVKELKEEHPESIVNDKYPAPPLMKIFSLFSLVTNENPNIFEKIWENILGFLEKRDYLGLLNLMRKEIKENPPKEEEYEKIFENEKIEVYLVKERASFTATFLSCFSKKTILVAKRFGEDKMKISLRSSTIDCGKFLKDFTKKYGINGGGHPEAGGALIYSKDFEKLIEELNRAL